MKVQYADCQSIVVGAGGGIGSALADELEASGRPVMRLSRATNPPLDLIDESSIANAADLAGRDLTLIVVATGVLHADGFQPEKTYRHLDAERLGLGFAVNAIGPALIMKHFLPRLARNQRAVFATLSARVGSISDNMIGGWYGYRAAKAALNQFVRTASIELARTHPLAICIGLHPGTVDTRLSRPYAKHGLNVQTPADAARKLINVIDHVVPELSGCLLDNEGQVILP